MSSRNNTELVREALEMAVDQLQPPPGLIHHTDQGQNYTTKSYRDQVSELGMISSMSRTRNCWDSAVTESFFATLNSS